MRRLGRGGPALVFVLAVLAAGAPAWAVPGDLDAGFGTSGVYTAGFQTSFATAEDAQLVAVDADRRVYLAANLENAPGGGLPRKVNVQRLSPQGVLDIGYGTGGTATLPFPGDTYLSGIAIDAQGRVVVAGTNDFAGGAKIALGRLTTGGQPDAGFDGDGWLVTGIAGATSVAPDGLAIDDAGRLLVASTAIVAGPVANGAVTRFGDTGVLDAGYGAGGTRLFGGAGTRATAIATLPGGAAYAAGWDDYELFVAARLTSGGALDGAFDGDGVATTNLGRATNDLVTAYGLAVDAQQRPVLAGQFTVYAAGTARAVVARFTAAGAPDAGFGGTPVPGAAFIGPLVGARGVTALVCGGRILVTGSTSRPPSTNRQFLAALSDSGVLDPTFAPAAATPGIATLDLGQYNNGVSLARDGASVLTSGFRRTNPPLEDFAVVSRSTGACGAEPPLPPPPGPPSPPAPAPSAAPPMPRPAPAISVAKAVAFPSTRACASRRRFSIRLRVPRDANVVEAAVFVNGRRAAVRRGARLRSTVDLRNLPKGRFRVEVRLRLADGRTVKDGRRYRTCAPRRRR
jgi:uncharacterized delta-60 repeat protein